MRPGVAFSVEFGARVAAALMVAACGNTTGNAGGAASATATATTPPPPAIVSREHLDVGAYSTTPRPPPGAAGNPSTGAVADAQDMSDFVVGPWDVDPSLITPYLSSYFVLTLPTRCSSWGRSRFPTPQAGTGSSTGSPRPGRQPTRAP